MSFWTLPSAIDKSRKLRSTLLNRETSPDTDMFFETTPSFSMGGGRSHFADRFGDVMSDARRGLRGFPSQLHHQHPSFESLHRQHSVPRRTHHWMDDGDDFDNLSGHNLQRSDSIPIQVTHHNPPRRHPSGSSRSSTPDTAKSYDSGSDGSSSCLASGASSSNAAQGGAFEEHCGVTARSAGSRPATFTARRQPKVHHIPIRVEPRDHPDGSAPNSQPPSQPTSPPVNDCSDQPVMPQQVASEESPKKESQVPPNLEKETVASCGGKNGQKRTQDDILEEVTKDLRMLRQQVEGFQGGSRTDKGYLYLDEMLTRNLIKLDDIVVEGNETLRQKRRAAVREVNACICALEEKLTQEDGEPMDHVQAPGVEEEDTTGRDEEQQVVTLEDHVLEDAPRDEGEMIEVVPEQEEGHNVAQNEAQSRETVETLQEQNAQE